MTLVAITPPPVGKLGMPIVHDLVTVDLSSTKGRIDNIRHLINLASLLKPLADMINSASSEYQPVRHCTVEVTTTLIVKVYTSPDAESRVQRLQSAYNKLREKKVPNVDQLISVRGNTVHLGPRGIATEPGGESELRQCLKCVLEALIVTHQIPLYHRDIRWSNIVRAIEDQSKWFIIDWEDAAYPPTLAQEDFTPESHSPAIKHDGHGAEVDIWGVGHLITTCMAADISMGMKALGRKICEDSERLTARAVLDMIDETTYYAPLVRLSGDIVTLTNHHLRCPNKRAYDIQHPFDNTQSPQTASSMSDNTRTAILPSAVPPSIAILPPELLCEIFLHAHYLLHHHPHASLAFLPLSHVCRHWRAIALSLPELWSNIPVFHRSWTGEMLLRSKNATLSVRATFDPELESGFRRANERALEAVLKHLPTRIGHLEIAGLNPYAVFLFLKSSFPSSPSLLPIAQSLHTLHLSCPPLTDTSWDGYRLLSRSLLEAPNLRELKLDNMTLDWADASFPWMKRLAVRNPPETLYVPPSAVLAVLKEMPLLEELELVQALVEDVGVGVAASTSDRTSLGAAVELRHLRKFIVKGRDREVEALLAHLVLHPDVELGLVTRLR
ncbi:unnamed protein product [Cyclocybe aegerita]|uniref:F-box domain-containing protein n=1 Tax=Cyclocybe aegerita TaxID=1973307 RepID=A0A8S0VQN8_CYCAE|nr:unnamed protein product [Cyclocybe aegerita]